MERAHAALRSVMKPLVGLQLGAATVLFTLTGVLMAAQILARKGLGLPLVWAEDLVVFMFVWTTFLGAAVLYDRKAALAIDTLVARLSPRAQGRIAFAVDLLILAALLYLVKLTWEFLTVQRGMGHKLGGATGIPSWVLTLSVLVGFVSMTGSTVASLLKAGVPAREAA